MKAITFKEANQLLHKPEGITDEQCQALPVWTDKKHCVSCWQATWKERLFFLLTGRVWLWVWSGHTQPPVAASVDMPFKKAS